MWKTLYFICGLSLAGELYSQGTSSWQVEAFTPIADYRFDDIFFINDSVGWIVGDEHIYKTYNGGIDWDEKFDTTGYFRNIKFFDEHIGFAGILYLDAFYKTLDGGDHWYDIADSLGSTFKNICGMSIADDSTIFLCGVWQSPAYIYKSSDRGHTWTYIDMGGYAHSLVDIKFIDKDHGYVTGQCADVDSGGIILFTENGGISWDIRKKTHRPNEIVWKIQSPDSMHLFASIQDLSGEAHIRMLRSSDKGISWEIKNVTYLPDYEDSQMIGFIDSLHGWIGGWGDYTWETLDGGDTWALNTFGENLNRFVKMNDTIAYASGDRVYKYAPDEYIAIDNPANDASHQNKMFKIYPVPSDGDINIQFDINRSTFLDLSVYDIQGKLVDNIYHSIIENGSYTKHLHNNLPAGKYNICFYTNEYLQFENFIILK